MKKLILTTALASLLVVSGSSFAADPMTSSSMSNTSDTMSNTPSEMQGKMGMKMMKNKMDADAKRLNLTSDQKMKIENMMKDSKMKLDSDIRGVLDDKQKVEFDKIQAEHKAAWDKHKSAN